ncbi:hypothetical protein BCR44DRAFT_73368 [Catenaria anguillulae PL171]|uniref:Transmembrane protein n=1 Tax=Catenaria anguillulae PL171 TaxID=765915 RepID=A0A1Y2HPW4_9FUNG|nr:hypothetical protein BCR44DRAFT_73368 [Catenaria anguillulae PL171]
MSASIIMMEADKVKQAILQATINLAGVALVAIVYLNYLLLKPYIRPLFWATVFSVPLHAVKNEILHYIFEYSFASTSSSAAGPDDSEADDTGASAGISALRVFWLGAKITCKACFGELYVVCSVLLKLYFRLVSRISALPPSSSPPGAPEVVVVSSSSATASAVPSDSGSSSAGNSTKSSSTNSPTLRISTSLQTPPQPRPLSMEWAKSSLAPLSAFVENNYAWLKDFDPLNHLDTLQRRKSDSSLATSISASGSAANSTSISAGVAGVPIVRVSSHDDDGQLGDENMSGRLGHSTSRSASPPTLTNRRGRIGKLPARSMDDVLGTSSQRTQSPPSAIDPNRSAPAESVAHSQHQQQKPTTNLTSSAISTSLPLLPTTPPTQSTKHPSSPPGSPTPAAPTAPSRPMARPRLGPTTPGGRTPRLGTLSRDPSPAPPGRTITGGGSISLGASSTFRHLSDPIPLTSSPPASTAPTSDSSSDAMLAAARATSSFYLALVWRLCCVYLLIQAWHTLGPARQAALGFTLAALAATHVAWHLARRLFHLYLRHHVHHALEWALAHVHPLDTWAVRAWDACKPGAAVKWVRRTYKSGKSNAKEVFVRNANSFAALFVLTSILSVGLALVGFLVFKVGQETTTVVEGTVNTIGSHLSDEMRVKMQGVVQDAYGVAFGWVEAKATEMWPQANVTAVYRKLARGFAASQAAAAAAAGSSGTDVAASSTDNKSLLAGELAKLTQLPHTAHVVAAVTSGDLASLIADPAQLMAMVTELRGTLALDAGNATQYLSSLVGSMGNVTASLLLGALQYLMDFFDLIFQVVMFLVTLHALLSRETAVTTWIAQLLILADPDMLLTRSLEDNIISVLVCTAKLTTFHSLLTWLTFSAFGIELTYISTFATALLSIVPLVPPMWIAVPAALSLYWVHARMWSALALLAIHVYAAWFVDTAFFAEIPDVNPYFSALAFILGLWAFGLEGLVLGPLLMSVVPTVFAVVSSKLRKSQIEAEARAAAAAQAAGDEEGDVSIVMPGGGGDRRASLPVM